MPPPCQSPYQGLLRYEKGNADSFFGRADLTAQIVHRLHLTNCLTVMGASGSGKSSVIRAGVLPTVLGLKDFDGVESFSGKWKDLITSPTAHPLSNMAEIIAPNDPAAQQQIQEQILQADSALADALVKNISTDNHQTLLIIDQFEELFTLCSDEVARRVFINNLLYIANNQQIRLKIIFILRADFYQVSSRYFVF